MSKYFIKDGKCEYKIVVPENRSAVLDYAVKELNFAMKECCEIELELVEDTENYKGPFLYLGNTERAKILNVEEKLSQANYDAYFIGVRGDDVWITAHGEEGLIYGVYRFLNLTLGSEYFAPDEYVLPKVRDAILPTDDVFVNPSIETRVRSLSWSKYGGDAERRFGFNSGNGRNWVTWAHTFFQLIPKSKYWESHREFYSVDGKQLCLSCEELVATMTEEIEARLTDERFAMADILNVMIGQEDGCGFCQCEKCKENGAKYGGNAGILMRFVNRIADNVNAFVEKKHPKKTVKIITFGYSETQIPPVKWETDDLCKPVDESVVAHKNVGVMLAPLAADWSNAIDDKEFNEKERKSFIGWNAIRPELFVWTYDSLFDDTFIFIDNWEYMQANYKAFVKYGAKYVFDQGDACHKFPFEQMKNYVRGKLMWNVDEDVEMLIKKFMTNYYKEASDVMYLYFNKLREHTKEAKLAYEKRGETFRQYSYVTSWPDYRESIYWQKDFLEECIEQMDTARVGLQDGEWNGAKNRLEVEMLSPIYTYLEIYGPEAELERLKKYVAFFKRVSAYNGIVYYAEWGAEYTKQLERKYATWDALIVTKGGKING